MKIYLVGGAIRNEFLGLPIEERDWLVTQATPEELLAQNFIPVGKSFPVFLHPVTKEEYALARKEKKTGPGYKGFSVEFSPNISLEEDLFRRDLTINAMAKDLETQTLFDPYGGLQDLQEKRLRHVSEAFCEDPLRILRTARFASALQPLGFFIDPGTLTLMAKMVQEKVLEELSPDRIWKEIEKVLLLPNPLEFFLVLEKIQALKILFPHLEHRDDLKALEICCKKEAGNGIRPIPRFLCLNYHQGKLENPFPQKYNIPQKYEFMVVKVASYASLCHQLPQGEAKEIANLLRQLKSSLLEDFLFSCEIDFLLKNPEIKYVQGDLLRQCYNEFLKITSKEFLDKNIQGYALGQEIQKAQIQSIERLLQTYVGK